jgi:hypothetical protein
MMAALGMLLNVTRQGRKPARRPASTDPATATR